MKCTSRMVCAGALVLALAAGCQMMDLRGFFALETDGVGGERVITGSVDSVAQSVQATLGRMGLQAVVSKQGETVRVTSRTAGGAGFTVVLVREKGQTGEQTRVHLEWDGPHDEQLGIQFLGQLETVRRG